jgi:hypothetical protein
MMRSWTRRNGSNPLGKFAPALREDPGGCESADHPKIARTAEGGVRSKSLFGSGLAGLGLEQKVTEIRFFLRLLCFAAPDYVAKYASYSSLERLLDERFKRIFASLLQ